MAIITKTVNNTKYIYEKKSYREGGKVKSKWKCLGKLDENGNLIPSKNLLLQQNPVSETTEQTNPATDEVIQEIECIITSFTALKNLLLLTESFSMP